MTHALKAEAYKMDNRFSFWRSCGPIILFFDFETIEPVRLFLVSETSFKILKLDATHLWFIGSGSPSLDWIWTLASSLVDLLSSALKSWSIKDLSLDDDWKPSSACFFLLLYLLLFGLCCSYFIEDSKTSSFSSSVPKKLVSWSARFSRSAPKYLLWRV